MPKTYPSKVDWLVMLPVLALPVIFVLTSIGASAAQSHGLAAALRALFLLTVVFTLWTLVGTSYTLDATTLLVRCGPFRWQIPLREIQSVTVTQDRRSGPALSLDRLCIEYSGGRRMLISPRDKDAFMRDLERRRT